MISKFDSGGSPALIADKLTRLRSTETPHHEFKMLLDAVSSLLFYEASRNLATQNQRIRTTAGAGGNAAFTGDVLLVPILRAGLAMVNGITDFAGGDCR